MARPAGVTVLGLLMIFAGVGFAITGFTFVLMGSVNAMAAAKTSGESAAMLSALGAAAGIIFVLFGGVHVVLAFGILKMRNIARILTIFLFILIGSGAILGMVATFIHYSTEAFVWNGSMLVAAGLALWYLMRPEVKASFGA
jgi:hypothetical protein